MTAINLYAYDREVFSPGEFADWNIESTNLTEIEKKILREAELDIEVPVSPPGD